MKARDWEERAAASERGKIPYSVFQNVFGVCKTCLNPHICYLSLESNIWKLATGKKNGLKSI